MNDTRRCSQCGDVKAVSEFSRNSSARDGVRNQCKGCQAERARRYRAEHAEERREYNRQYNAKHPEEERERNRRYRAKHPDEGREYSRQYNAKHPEEERERARRYRAKHPDEGREYSRRYRAEHAEERREYNRRYRAKHPDEGRVRRHKRRAFLQAAPGHHTAADVRLQIRAQTDKRGRLICWWCDEPIEGTYHEDHRIPLDRGGSNWPENIVIAHATCNLSKGAKLPWEFCGRLL
jgi:hypothetical protein